MAALVEGLQFSTLIQDKYHDSDEEFHLKDLMSKLRHKSNQLKSWIDTAKALRIAVSDKRYQSDALDRCRLQRSLDTLQKAIKVTTFSGMQERLEVISRQLGLKYNIQGSTIFISSDMFYVEVQEEPSGGGVRDVKITHEQWDPLSCPDLAKLLAMSDFSKFTDHLKGLIAIYSIVGDKKQKTKAYISLQSLEQDLNMVAQLQSSISGVANYIHRVLGILQPRQGGQPMKLTYFVAPYDLLNSQTKTSYPMTVEAITEHDLGHSATVVLEKSAPQKLQTMPLMTIKKHDGGSLPSFAPLTHLNSVTLPAIFLLKLQKAVPVSTALLNEIQSITGNQFVDNSTSLPLIELLTENVSGGKITQDVISKGLHVSLPGQQHCYFINMSTGIGDIRGSVVKEIPFVHPTAVPKILTLLRQQLLFNTVIGSCVRSIGNEDLDSSLVFEVSAMSLQHVSITFEHPLDDSIATADFDLSDITSVRCKIMSSSTEKLCSDEMATKVVQRCLSIPVTMRAILRHAVADLEKQMPPSVEIPAKTNSENNPQKYTDSPFFCRRQYSSSLLPNGQGLNNFSHGIPTASAQFPLTPSPSITDTHRLQNPQFPSGLPRQCAIDQGQGYPVQRINYPNGINQRGPFPSPTVPTRHGIGLSPFSQGDSSVFFPPNASQPGDYMGVPSQQGDMGMNKNPMLSSLLDQDPPAGGNTSILSSLLGDNPDPSITSMPKPKKPRRRRTASTEQGSAKSPKRKRSDGDDFLLSDSNSSSAFDFLPSVTETVHMRSDDIVDVIIPKLSQASPQQLSQSPKLVSPKMKSPIDNFPDEQKSSTEIAAILNKNSMSASFNMALGKPASTSSGTGKNLAKMNRPSSVQSMSDERELQTILERESPLDPDLFTNKETGTFTPSDFIGVKASQPDNQKDLATDSLDFSAELLTSSLSETLSEPGEGNMDLDACDANAFGTGLNPAVMASKLTVKSDKQSSVLGSESTETVAPPSQESPKQTVSKQAEEKVVSIEKSSLSKSPVSKHAELKTDKKEKTAKDGKTKEKKKYKSISSDKGDRRILKTPTVSVRFLDKSVDSPQEALDLSKKEKPLKVTIRTYPELPKDSQKTDDPSSGKDAEGSGESSGIKTIIVPKTALPRPANLELGRKRLESDEVFRKRKRSEDVKKERGGKKKRDEGRTLVDPSKTNKSTSGEKLPTRIKITTSGGKIKISSTPRSAVEQPKTPSSALASTGIKFTPTPSKLASLPRIPKLSQRQSSTGEASPKLPTTPSQVSSSPLAPKVASSPLKVPQSPLRLASPANKTLPASKVLSPVRMQSLLRPGSSPTTKIPLLPLPTMKSPVPAGSVRFPTAQGRRPSATAVTMGGAESKDSKLTSKTPTIKLKPIPVPGSEVSKRDPRIAASNKNVVPTIVASNTKPSPPAAATAVPQQVNQTPPKARCRKGSLTAVIDKLTKSHPCPTDAAAEPPRSAAAVPENKRNIFESLAVASDAGETSTGHSAAPESSKSNKEKSESDFSSRQTKSEAGGSTYMPPTSRTDVLETPESPPMEETKNIVSGQEREIPVEPLAGSPAHTKIDSAPQSPDPEPAHNLSEQKTVEIPIAAKDADSSASSSSRVVDFDDAMFKAPTPKTPQSVGNRSPKAGDMPEFGGQDSSQMRSRSNSVTSSHPSSPEDGLVIDCCPGTPKEHQMAASPHSTHSRSNDAMTAEPALPSESASVRSPMAPAWEKMPNSSHSLKAMSPAAPVKSPAAVSVKSALSPCMIDDDLMDEALMGFGN